MMCNNSESWRVWGKASFPSRSPKIAAGYFAQGRWASLHGLSVARLKKLARGRREPHDRKATDGETSGQADRSLLHTLLTVKEKRGKADPVFKVEGKVTDAWLRKARVTVQGLLFENPRLWASDLASEGKPTPELVGEKGGRVLTSWERAYHALCKRREELLLDVEVARRTCICLTEDFIGQSHTCLQCPTHWRNWGRPSRVGRGVELHKICPGYDPDDGKHCPVCCPDKWTYDPKWKEFAMRYSGNGWKRL